MVISIDNAEHYIWGEVCDGWHFLKRDDMSVIQERIPAGATEVMHYHNSAMLQPPSPAARFQKRYDSGMQELAPVHFDSKLSDREFI